MPIRTNPAHDTTNPPGCFVYKKGSEANDTMKTVSDIIRKTMEADAAAFPLSDPDLSYTDGYAEGFAKGQQTGYADGLIDGKAAGFREGLEWIKGR